MADHLDFVRGSIGFAFLDTYEHVVHLFANNGIEPGIGRNGEHGVEGLPSTHLYGTVVPEHVVLGTCNHAKEAEEEVGCH